VDTFIRNENIKLYRRALAESSDEGQRRVLLKLLSDEKSAVARDRKAPPAGIPVET
jgi:hypothetical protein